MKHHARLFTFAALFASLFLISTGCSTNPPLSTNDSLRAPSTQPAFSAPRDGIYNLPTNLNWQQLSSRFNISTPLHTCGSLSIFQLTIPVNTPDPNVWLATAGPRTFYKPQPRSAWLLLDSNPSGPLDTSPTNTAAAWPTLFNKHRPIHTTRPNVTAERELPLQPIIIQSETTTPLRVVLLDPQTYPLDSITEVLCPVPR